MAVQLYRTATQYTANALTIVRGSADDIVSVGVYHAINPNTVPAVEDFDIVTLVQPGNPLASGDNIDVLALIGPRNGDVVLAPGDWQRWVLITTATEDIIVKVDIITVL